MTTTPLNDGQAGDVIPPTVRVASDPTTGLVTITAAGGESGSGVMQLLYNSETPPKHFVPYGGLLGPPRP